MTNDAIASSPQRLRECAVLFGVFARIGLVLIGGGYVMLPLLQREVVERRGWISEKDMMNYFAIGQSTPGVIAVNAATFIGFRRAGIWGASAAVCGIVFPALVIICCIAGVYSSLARCKWVETGLSGMRVAVSVLLLYTVHDLLRKTCRNAFAVVVTIAAFCAVAVAGISPVLVIMLAGSAGWLFYRKKR